MPCKHAMATIWNMSLNSERRVGILESWVHPAYWLTTWKKVYDFKINPVKGSSMWPKSQCPTILTPPKHHTQVGRPNKKRRKTYGEMVDGYVNKGKLSKAGKSVTCGKCGNVGHNKRS